MPYRAHIDLATLIEQYTSGMSLSELCKVWHSDNRTLKRRLRKAGVKLRSHAQARAVSGADVRRKRVYPTAEIVEYYEAGRTIRECSAKFHIHHRVLVGILKAARVYRTLSQARALVWKQADDAKRQAIIAGMPAGYAEYRDSGRLAADRQAKRLGPELERD